MTIIIGIVGPIAAGKSTATDYIKMHYGAVTFRFSDPLRAVLNRLHIETSRSNLQLLSTILRQNFGEDLLSKALASDAATATDTLIITEGVRRTTDIVHLAKLPNFHLIAIDAASRTRFERLTKRSENSDDSSKTWEEFMIESNQESEQQILSTMNTAEKTLNNNETKAQLFEQIDQLLQGYGATRTN